MNTTVQILVAHRYNNGDHQVGCWFPTSPGMGILGESSVRKCPVVALAESLSDLAKAIVEVAHADERTHDQFSAIVEGSAIEDEDD